MVEPKTTKIQVLNGRVMPWLAFVWPIVLVLVAWIASQAVNGYRLDQAEKTASAQASALARQDDRVDSLERKVDVILSELQWLRRGLGIAPPPAKE